VSYVGLNYTRMRDYLVACDVRDIWHLVPMEAKLENDEAVGTRSKVVARRMSGWENDRFWQTMSDAQSVVTP
jgi:histidinol-phosphatase (PHP family)